MMLNRTFDDMDDSMELIGDSSPMYDEKLAEWALTDVYGTPGLVFEVMKNGAVSSLTLF